MTGTAPADDRAAAFEPHRPRLFGLAYRMLGLVHDAEDVVQETYLRFHRADAAALASSEAWLVAVATRLCIDRLRHLAVQREAYAGQWLPEPLATPAPDHASELSSDLSIAFLVLLDRLAPEERAAFLLREVFGAPYAEIAAALEKSEAACRQMVHRARERVRRPARLAPDDLHARRRLFERFHAALAAEDRDGLLAMLAEDVVLVGDGGGKAPALPQPVSGADRLATLLVTLDRTGRRILAERGAHALVYETAWINGEPAGIALVDGLVGFTSAFDVDDLGRIRAIYRTLNPEKLRHVGPPPYLDPRA